MPDKFKGTCPSAQYIIDLQNTSIKDGCPLPFNPKISLFKLKTPCYICGNSSSNLISSSWSESISDKEIVPRICSLNEAL